MSGNVKLFRITNGSAEELLGRPVKLAKKLHLPIARYRQACRSHRLELRRDSHVAKRRANSMK